MRHATAFKRGARIIVHSLSTTTAGVGVASPPFEVLDQDAPPVILGEAVKSALSASRSEVPHPPGSVDIGKPLYKAAGVKSWSSFVRGAVCCEISEDDLLIYFDPTENKGARGGFQPLEGREALTLRGDASAEEVGEILRKAFALSA